MPDISIIVLSKTPSHFHELHESLLQQVDDSMVGERILVNNANDMLLTAQALKRGWMVIEPGYNTSFSAGNNLAAKAAMCGHGFLLLNDDLKLRDDFLHQLWKQAGTADVLGAMLLHSDGTVNHAGTGMRRDLTVVDHIGRHAEAASFRGTCPRTPSVTFAAALVARSCWHSLGGLDERYYYGWEDTDFCLRALAKGFTIRCCRDAVAVHDECGTRPRGSEQDRTNARLFRDTWTSQAAGLLDSYVRRASPEPVEGIFA